MAGNDDKKVRYNPKNIGIFAYLAIIAAIPIITAVLFLCKDNYYIFTEKRIAEMEQIFQLDFDGVKLEKYSEGQFTKRIKLYGIEDYEKFMDGVPDCHIKAITRDCVRYNLDNNTESKCDMEKYEAKYDYAIGSEYYYIYFFEENNGIYSAEIILSEI